MLFTTKISIAQSPNQVDYDTPIMFMGSCFAEHIGEKCMGLKLPSFINPYGVLYNPCSIALCIEELVKGKQYTQSNLDYDGEMYFSYNHHSSFNSTSAMDCIDHINQNVAVSSDFLKQSNYLFISLGSAHVYLLDNKKIVANCHKTDSKRFVKLILSVDEVVESLHQTINVLHDYNPDLKIIFTVSPVLYLGDGAHANRISKATLLLAVERICKLFPTVCDYFPAYEIVQDELRDYRYYNSDMTHPSQLAIDYIWERFVDSRLSRSALATMEKVSKIVSNLQHRPFYPKSESYKNFLLNTYKDIVRLRESYPKIDFETELQFIQSKISLKD